MAVPCLGTVLVHCWLVETSPRQRRLSSHVKVDPAPGCAEGFVWVQVPFVTKRAILDWASQLGTPGVPTFHALSQSQDYIKGLIGDSVMAATTGMGHKIFIQDIPYMIVKDYANPLT
ncbi:hypothetical protein EI94DRAFT_1817544 [Lactarius quietus]|nr:hypothetical protein EI94DRAFT_1817544 [Lactarius quietus]